MAGIMVSVPFIKPHTKFLPHFMEFYAANKIAYDLHLNFQMFRALHHAQAVAVRQARKFKCSHILWTEDDHWMFPVDGIEVLLEADKDVIGFQSYRKEFPFLPLNYRKRNPEISLVEGVPNLYPFYGAKGTVETCDLIGWNFLLTKLDVFDRIDDPFTHWGFSPTDSQFCQNCLDVGIQPHVHFGWVVAHGTVGPDQISFHRRMWDSMNAHSGHFAIEAVQDMDPRILDIYRSEAEDAVGTKLPTAAEQWVMNAV